MKKIILSGVKPTGRPHLGNYFGAMKQFVDALKDDNYECYFFIADYHALNLIQNASEMQENIIELAIDYLAIGLDDPDNTKKITLFKQSDVSAQTELCWIFDSITTMPYLMRAHAYKDAEAKNKEISVGTFNYPMLMAADILLYNTDYVLVGQDQKQHVEYARDTAQKFNNMFCRNVFRDGPFGSKIHEPKPDTFKMPLPIILEKVKIVPGTDGRKMSKSYGNDIGLFATDEEIVKKVKSIVTDSSSGIPENVYAIHALFRDKEYLDKLYTKNKGKYKDLKDALIKDIQDFIRPMRERREKIAQDRNRVIEILKTGGERAKKVADQKLEQVKKNIGVTL